MQSVIMRRTGGPEVLELIEAEQPRPGLHEVLVRAHAIAVSRPDVLIRTGTYKWMPPLPTSPGSDMAGVIAEIGSAVTTHRPGQRVVVTARDLPVRGGCYAEYMAIPAAAAHILPDHADLQQAAVLPTYQVAYAMMHDMGLRPGARSVFVHGATGSIGSALVDLARAQGLDIIGSAGSPEKLDFARSIGVHHAVDYRSGRLVAEVMDYTGGRGVDLAFDHIVGEAFAELLHMLAIFGTMTVYNVFTKMPEKDVFGEIRALVDRSIALRHFSMHSYDHDEPGRRRLMTGLIALLGDGRINPRIGRIMPLAQAADAHRLLESGAVLGKIILQP